MKTAVLQTVDELSKSRFWELDEAALRVARRCDDWRGRALRDRRGQRLGRIDALYIDDREKRVRFVRGAVGGLLGIGVRRFLIPVDAICSADEREVWVELTAEQMASSPPYAANAVATTAYFRTLYAYYGYAPFWTVGYRYPAFPYYPAPSAKAGGSYERD